MPAGGEYIVTMWAVKTMWAIGKALDIDPLRGAGDDFVDALVVRAGSAPPSNEIDGQHVSIEADDYETDFLTFGSTSDVGLPWATLRIRNIVATVYLCR